ncbi:hypothetical protein JCM3765_001327 [Sporobolomyces pararoseus]
MEKRESPPHTPPPALTRNNLSLAPIPPGVSNSPPPLRAKSPFASLFNPPLIIEDDGDETSSEEESPIKDREASRWLAKQGRKSVSEESVYSSPGLSDRADVQGIVSAFDSQGSNQGAFARKIRFEDSPTSVRSSSSSFSDRYVPPPLRGQRNLQEQQQDDFKPNPYLPSLGKNSLASFDRSSAPESEDSFYTFSNEPSFAFSHFSSTAPSTPSTSRNLSRSFGLSPKGFAASPPLPRSISRPSRLNTPSFERQQVIAEVEEDEATSEVGASVSLEVDEFDRSEEPLGPVLPLGSVREKGTQVDLSQLKAVDQGTPVEDCSGCGLVADRSFVVFNPCRHSCCPDCLNSMINGAAHKPPRPSDCFSCSRQVDGFDPCCIEFFSTRGGPGLAQVLSATLQQEDHKIRTASRRSPGASSSRFVTGDELEIDKMRRLSRSGRRRSSVVAAAISASLLSRSRSKSTTSFSQPSSPTAHRTPRSPSVPISITTSRRESLADLPPHVALNTLSLPSGLTTPFEGASSSSQWSDQTQGILTPVLDWSAEPMPVFEKLFPGGMSTRSSRSSYESSADEVSIRSSLEALPSRRTEWPVVRLDNLPWSVTADEVEHWLPDGSLASDVGFSPELVENVHVERVTLAVHILCNRVDGRTLNQAFVECSSLEAAKSIVRSRDGTRLRGRPLHVAMSTQSELLTTIFPTYTPGFSGIDALPDIEAISSSCPLLLDSELTGLLQLCRLESPHALKAPERPYFNLVSIIEKLPFHQVEAYTAEQVSALFNACVLAVKTLKDIKEKVEEWRDILTVFIDAILRCPAFFASQKRKIVKLAGGLGFVQHVPTKTIDVFYTQPSSSRASLAAALAFPAVPSSSSGRRISLVEQRSPSINREHLDVKSNLVIDSSPSPSAGSRSTSASDAFLSILQAHQQPRLSIDPSACSPIPSPSYVFPPTPSPRTAQFPSTSLANSPSRSQPSRQRRRSSIARRLNIDASLVAAVARELGVTLA